MTEFKDCWGKYYVYNSELLPMLAAIKTADACGKRIIQDDLIKKVSYLIYSKIRRYKNANFYEDLVQEAKIGLLKAIEDFDAERGLNFFKFANWHLRRISRFVKWNYRNNPNNIIERFQTERLNDADVKNPEELLEKKETKKIIMNALSKMSDIDKDVVILKFGLGCKEHTFDQLGKLFSFSKQRMEQIKSGALKKLQKNKDIKNNVI